MGSSPTPTPRHTRSAHTPQIRERPDRITRLFSDRVHPLPVPCRYRRTAFVVSSVCWLLIAPEVQAQTPPPVPPTARAVRVAEAPVIDGRVTDDPAWIAIEPLVDFWQTAPDAGAAVSERTEVRILYTDDTLYFGVVLWDRDPAGLTVSDARRDSPLDDTDSFRILLDTYRDRQNGFIFATNPAALEYDGQVTAEGNNNPFGAGAGGGGGGGRQLSGSGGGFNLNWDGAWEVRTAMLESGWSAEFAIPFRTLRYEPGPDREWGVNFERTIRRRKETAYWAPLPIQFDLMRVSLAGGLTGLDLPAQRNLKLVPYALGEARERAQAGPETKFFGDIGLDTKYSVTPALTLDATRSSALPRKRTEPPADLSRTQVISPSTAMVPSIDSTDRVRTGPAT